MPSIGAPEIILIIVVLVLLFGARKLPELARGSGRALRIFKAETKGLGDDKDDEQHDDEERRQIEAQRSSEAAHPVEGPVQSEQTRPDTER